MKKEKWAIYTRVSTEEQAERYGLDAQKKILTELAQKSKLDFRLYDEGAVSGETIEARPVMQSLLRDIESGKYVGCYVIEWQRLSRSEWFSDWDRIVKSFIKGNAIVANPYLTLDPSKLEHRQLLYQQAVFSTTEKTAILMRTTRGKAEKISQGKSIGATSTPFGYYGNKDNDGKIEAQPEESKMLKKMFEMASKGQSPYAIAKKLNATGYATRYGRMGWNVKKERTYPLWRPSTVYKILTRDYYTGKPCFYEFTKYHKAKVEVRYPAIIEPELFELVQLKLKSTRFRKKSNTYFFMLKGLLKCGFCGRTMYGHGSPKVRNNGHTYVYKFYRCENKNPPPRGTNCKMQSVSLEAIEDEVKQQVFSTLENTEKLARLIKQKNETSDKDISELKARHAALTKEISERKTEEERAVTAYTKGIISDEELDRQKKRITGERTELTREANRIESEMQAILISRGRYQTLQGYVKQTWGKIQDKTTEELFDFYHVCIENIILDYDEKSGKHSIDIQYAIPVISGKDGGKGGTFAKFHRGDHKNPQRHGTDSNG